MTKSTLSIVIITKNEEEHLPVLLKSIKGQTLQPDEIIVADAKSEDKTREIAKKFGCRVVDGGMPSAGRNLGAKAAKSDYVLFFDADVQLLDEKFLEVTMKEVVKRDLDFATYDVKPLDGGIYDEFSHWFYNRYVRLIAPLHQHAAGFCILVKRDFHERVGGFDEQITFCEDHEYAVRANKAGKYGILSPAVHTSVRRFDNDGRLNIAVKFFLAEMHFWFLGPIRDDKFKYKMVYKPGERKTIKRKN